MNLTADGQSAGPPSNPSDANSEASATGIVIDYLLPLHTALGDTVKITFSQDASGATDAYGSYLLKDIYESDYGVSYGIYGGGLTCSGFTGGTLYGAVSGTCIGMAAITAGKWLEFTSSATGHAASMNGYTTMNASNTSKVTSIQVLTSQGVPDPNAILYDASGYNYDAPQQAATPEPASVLFCCVGLLLLMWQRIARTCSA